MAAGHSRSQFVFPLSESASDQARPEIELHPFAMVSRAERNVPACSFLLGSQKPVCIRTVD
jgi:hypothetical protein